MKRTIRGKDNRSGFLVVLAALVCAWLVLAPAPADAADKKNKKNKKQQRSEKLAQLPMEWFVWLEEEVYPLITKEQKQAFLSLETDSQRKAFAERLWVLWGRQSGLGTSFRMMYEDRLAIARSEYGNTIEDRARILLLHGPPVGRHNPNCRSIFTNMDFWIWPYIEGLGEDVVVLFFEPMLLNRWRMWTEMDGMQRLYNSVGAESRYGIGQYQPNNILESPQYRCPNGDVTMRLLQSARIWSREPNYLRFMNHAPTDELQGRESTANRFMEFSALLDDNAEPLEFEIKDDVRGARGGSVSGRSGLGIVRREERSAFLFGFQG